MSNLEKLALASMLTLSSLGGNAQNASQQYLQNKQKSISTYMQHKKEAAKNYMDAKTADFNAYRSGNSAQRGNEMAETATGGMEYIANLPTGKGLDLDSRKFVKSDVDSRGFGISIMVADNGVMMMSQSKSDGLIANYAIEKDGKIEYHITTGGEYDTMRRESVDKITDNPKIVEALNKIYTEHGNMNSAFGKALQQKTGQRTENAGNTASWHVAESEYGNIEYTFNEDGFNMRGRVSVDVRNLLPKTYYNNKTKLYTIGSSQSFSQSAALEKEEDLIRNLVAQNIVYKDLQKRAAGGEQLGKEEQSFMKQHIKDLVKEGLSMNSQGKISQMGNQMNNTRGNNLSL